jgi:hypothetical protein
MGHGSKRAPTALLVAATACGHGEPGPSFPTPYADAAWAMDSSTLLVGTGDGLFSVETSTGSTERIADFVTFEWSQRRGEIASWRVSTGPDSNTTDLVVVGEDGSEPSVIATSPDGAVDSPIGWSADGEQLLVSRSWRPGPGRGDTQDNPSEVWVINADGSDPRRIRGEHSRSGIWAQWRPEVDPPEP